MADGLKCIHCGWQETDHEGSDLLREKDVVTRQPGRKKSLAKCRGFQPNKRHARSFERQRAKEREWAGIVAHGRARTYWTFMRDMGFCE